MSNVTLKTFDPLNQRDEWLTWRRRGIGGSDIAAILGWSNWAHPAGVYLDKTGQLDDHDAGEAARWGKLLEAAIADEFTERTGLHVAAEQLCVAKVMPGWQRCTLDGLVLETPGPRPKHQALTDALGVLEIKNSAAWAWDTIPDEYECQVQWQLGITGLTHAWLAVLHGGRRLQIHELEADPAAFEALTQVAERFWTDHVLARRPPPADSSAATTRALKDAYRDRATEGAIELTDAAHAAILAWQPTKQRAKEILQEVDLIENVLRNELGEHTTGTLNGEPMITWKPQRAGGAPTYDTAAMAADGIDLDKYRQDKGTTRVLRPTKQLKDSTTT